VNLDTYILSPVLFIAFTTDSEEDTVKICKSLGHNSVYLFDFFWFKDFFVDLKNHPTKSKLTFNGMWIQQKQSPLKVILKRKKK
jgi:hypothetical protein